MKIGSSKNVIQESETTVVLDCNSCCVFHVYYCLLKIAAEFAQNSTIALIFELRSFHAILCCLVDIVTAGGVLKYDVEKSSVQLSFNQHQYLQFVFTNDDLALLNSYILLVVCYRTNSHEAHL